MLIRTRVLVVGQVICLLFLFITLYAGRAQLIARVPSLFKDSKGAGISNSTTNAAHDEIPMENTSTYTIPQGPQSTPTPTAVLPAESITAYLDAIFTPEATHLPRLDCPRLDRDRYAYLKTTPPPSSSPVKYFFALDLRECVGLLPRLISSIVEVINFLGPSRCALSVVEGPSTDGTGELLAALRPRLDALTTTYYLQSTNLSSKSDTMTDRIVKLAALRNLALAPLLSSWRYGDDTTILFLNDVAACAEDILELAHQRVHLGADMTCAVDWTYLGTESPPTFYDVWISRGMNGDSFFEILADPKISWTKALRVFWNNPDAKARFDAHAPFQVFSCWNGAVAFTAAAVLRREVEFRAAHQDTGECLQGEPQLFCKDMWFRGYGKIAVVPAVNLGYTDAQAAKIKAAKGYTSQWVGAEKSAEPEKMIDWQSTPPEQVKCMPEWTDQYWQAWDAGLT